MRVKVWKQKNKEHKKQSSHTIRLNLASQNKHTDHEPQLSNRHKANYKLWSWLFSETKQNDTCDSLLQWPVSDNHPTDFSFSHSDDQEIKRAVTFVWNCTLTQFPSCFKKKLCIQVPFYFTSIALSLYIPEYTKQN